MFLKGDEEDLRREIRILTGKIKRDIEVIKLSQDTLFNRIKPYEELTMVLNNKINFLIDNPPKYKKGDILFDNYKVDEIKLSLGADKFYYEYKIFSLNFPNLNKWIKEYELP